jgi:RNA polymerase sigma factor (sigma-70 family)
MDVTTMQTDVNSFTEGYSLYYSHIFRTIHSKVRDTHVAGDLTQELFIRYYEKFNSIDNHRRWLFSAAKFILLEYYRSRKGGDVEFEDVADEVRMTFVNGFRDTRIMIEEALENIEHFGDEQGKVLFDLVALHDYTYKEAGEMLGLTERTVRYRYGVITERIVAHFKKRGIRGLEDLL